MVTLKYTNKYFKFMSENPKKILYFVTLSEWGGAQEYVFDLATSLKDNPDYTPMVAVGGKKDGELIHRLLKTGIKIYYLRHLKREINFYNDWNAFVSTFKLCRQVRPDVVHLNSSKIGTLGAVAARLAGVKKIVYTVHGLVLNEPLPIHKKTFYWLAEKISSWFKSRIICVSEYDQKSLIKFGICALSKTEIIHNGIDVNEIHFLPREEARKKLFELAKGRERESDIVVGTIANLYPTKGLPYLVEAAREATAINNQLKFIIIGEGPDRKKIEGMIKNYHLENDVFLVGNISDAKRLLRGFDIFVMPSIKEGLSYTMIEASAAGLPIIATKVGGSPEIVDNRKNGLLVKAKDFSALANAIVGLANDERLQKILGEEAGKTAGKFSLSKMIDLTTSLYKML